MLENELPVWVSAKDVILEMLRRLTVKGGLNKAFAFDGPGVATLSVTQRATICNMIQELGARGHLPRRRADPGMAPVTKSRERLPGSATRRRRPVRDEMVIDLAQLEPLIAKPRNPDNVVPVRDVAGTKVAQVCVGPP